MPSNHRLLIIGSVSIIILLGIGTFLYLRNTSTKPAPSATVEQTDTASNSAQLKTEYNNPFDKKSQYSNPFADYQNPFDNLK